MEPNQTTTKFNAMLFATDSIAYRNMKYWSRNDLAEALQTTKYVVRHYENRTRKPRIEVIAAFCKLTECNIEKYFSNC